MRGRLIVYPLLALFALFALGAWYVSQNIVYIGSYAVITNSKCAMELGPSLECRGYFEIDIENLPIYLLKGTGLMWAETAFPRSGFYGFDSLQNK